LALMCGASICLDFHYISLLLIFSTRLLLALMRGASIGRSLVSHLC
jgi:hypothetical protein